MPGNTKTKRTLTPEQKEKMKQGRIAAARKLIAEADGQAPPAAPPQDTPAIAAKPVASQVAQPAPVNPAEPPRYGPMDVVKVFNPDNEDFNFRFGTKAQYDNKGRVVETSIEPIMYTLPAGQAISMHGYMADYVCNHLTSRILQKTNNVRQINSPIVRKAWAAKIVLGKEDIITPEAKLSEAEQIQRQFEKIQTTPVTEDEGEIPLAEADDLLNDIDQQTLADEGSEFPDADATA